MFTEEQKAEIAKQIEEATAGLKAKNEELIGDNKKLKTELRAKSEIKLEDFTALEGENEKLRADLVTANKAAKDATAAAEKSAKALEAEGGFTRKLLVENGLREQLAANGVTNPIHQKAAMAMLSGGVEIAADGETRVAKVGDKALADFVKEWAAGDEGKHFVAAPANGGGGAGGGSGAGGGAKQVTRDQFNGMAPAAQMAFSKEGGKVVDSAA